MSPLKNDPVDIQYKTLIEKGYSPIPRDPQEKIIEGIFGIIEASNDRKNTLGSILELTAKTIFRMFEFDEIGIGLKDRKDGLYRYEVLFGYRPSMIEDFKKMAYTYDDMVSYDKFPFIKTGKYSDLNPVEGLPEGERHLFNRPFELTEKRELPDEFHEGDYIDFWMYGYNKEIIGWFELSSPRNRRLPPRTTIRWIELIACICSSIVEQKWIEEDLARKR
jgi:hypothetical protein